jgi:site-specific DNA recombinase
MKTKNSLIVSYTRFSTDLQREDSCKDQERNILDYCRKNGIPSQNIIQLRDEGESGTDADRPGFTKLRGMIEREEVGTLLVDDLSRLTRNQDLQMLIDDIRFRGARLIAVSDGFDSDKEGTDMVAGFKGMMNASYIRLLSKQVHRGQEGRVMDDGSAGDYCFGYRSCFCDPNAQWDGRGPKPKKRIIVEPIEAAWVLQIFKWYAEDGLSIAQITKRLNKMGVSKGHRSSKPGWHRDQVRRILENTKYIGRWKWGATKTVRSSTGKKRQISVPDAEVVRRDRPALRIVPQELWDRVEARRTAEKERFAECDRPNTSMKHPTRLLSGLVRCGNCGGMMHVESRPTGSFYGCVNHRHGRGCENITRVPADQAEKVLLDYLGRQLTDRPDWLQLVIKCANTTFEEALRMMPSEAERLDREIGDTQQRITNLLNKLEEADSSPSLMGRIRELEDRQAELKNRRSQMMQADRLAMKAPDANWIKGKLANLAGVLASHTLAANGLIRRLVDVQAVVTVSPGRKRGRRYLDVTLKVPELIRIAFEELKWPEELVDKMIGGLGDCQGGGVIRLEVVKPSRMDALTTEIVKMREGGASWGQIGKALGIRSGNACSAYQVWKSGVAPVESNNAA